MGYLSNLAHYIADGAEYGLLEQPSTLADGTDYGLTAKLSTPADG
jgi:hypothetical protein